MNQETRRLEAARWVDRMNGPLFDSDLGGEFDSWMESHPDNRDAFADMMALWQGDDLHRALVEADRPVAVAPDPGEDMVPGSPRRRWHWPAVAAAAAMVALASLLWVPDILPRSYDSAAGQFRTVQLADGSSVDMGGNSRIRVQYLPWRRSVQLERGEARFDVTRDRNRPFTVAAGTAQVTVLGTQFHVDRLGPTTAVQVTRGAVRVANDSAGRNIRAGQAVRISGAGIAMVPLRSEDLSWKSGWYVAQNVPLSDLIEKLSRYSKSHITITDRDISKNRIIGRFNISDVDLTLDALKLSYGLKIEVVDGDIYIMK